MSTTSQRQRILDLLEADKTVLNTELNKICYRYAARIHELRDEGHLIATSYEKPGVYRYTYHGRVSAPQE